MPTRMALLSFIAALVAGATLALLAGLAATNAQAHPEPPGPITEAETPLNVDNVQDIEPFNVLVFSYTAGWRHTDGISGGLTAINALASEYGFNVTASENRSIFTEEGLEPFDVIFFLNTTSNNQGLNPGICPPAGYQCGDLFNASQQQAFENWFKSGNKGWVGAHSASDTEKPEDDGVRWPWYGGLLGNNAWFLAHGGQSDSSCLVTNPNEADHLSVKNPLIEPSWQLASQWTVQDEWYTFKNNPLNNVTPTAEVPHTPINVVLYRPFVSNTQTSTNCANANYPAAWYHEYDGGRAFYTARGHGGNRWAEADMRKHILGGILWAAGVEEGPADEEPPVSTATLTPASADGSNGWYKTAPSLNITATDNVSSANQITKQYRINNGNWNTLTNAVSITQQGELTIDYRSTDNAGNVEETRSLNLKVDTVAPSTSATTGVASVTLSASDATSGVAGTQYCIGNGCTPNINYNGAIEPGTAGEHVIRYRSTDNAGNVEAIKQTTLTIVKNDQLIMIAVALPNVTYGAPDITLGATASPSGLPVTVAASGACTANGDIISIVSAGTCSIELTQEGDGLWNPAQILREFDVAKAPTTIKVSTKKKVKKGKKITLKATVKTGNAAIRNQMRQGARIDFYVGNKRIGRATLNSSNVASVKAKAAGNWGKNAKIRAVFSGNDRFASSTSSKVKVRVNKNKKK